MSFIFNRRNAMIPSRPGLHLGAEDLRWGHVYSSNVDVVGVCKAIKLVGDGSEITGLPIPKIDWAAFGCNIVPDSNCLRNIGIPSKQFANIYSSNVYVSGAIQAPSYIGSGNHLLFDKLATSIYPANDAITLGNPTQAFDNVYTRNVSAHGDVIANKFVGDGSLLTNVKTNEKLVFDNINADVIPASNNIYNVGHPNLRWARMFAYDVHALGSLAGGKVTLTRPDAAYSYLSDGWTQGATNQPGVHTDIPNNINDKLGGVVDLAAKSAIIDILIVGELFSYTATMLSPVIAPLMSNLSPHLAHQFDVGTIEKPFRMGVFDTMHVGNNLVCLGIADVLEEMQCTHLMCRSTAVCKSDLTVEGTLYGTNIVVDGNISCTGSVLCTIPKVGPLLSNVAPYIDNMVDIGASNIAFRKIFGREIQALDRMSTRTLNVENDVHIQGKLNLAGNMFMNGTSADTTRSGFLIPSHMIAPHLKTLLFQNQTISGFMDINMQTGIIRAQQPGLYVVASYGWKTSRGLNDQDISWRIYATTNTNNSKYYMYLKGSDSKTIVLNTGDSIEIQVFPGFEPDHTYAPPLTIFNSGAIVITMLGRIDPFIGSGIYINAT